MKGGKIKIIKVTDSNIDKVNNLIQKKDQKVVGKFYADWCGHCNDLNSRVMPGVEEIIKKQSGPGILLNIPDGIDPRFCIGIGHPAKPPAHMPSWPKKKLIVESLVQWGGY